VTAPALALDGVRLSRGATPVLRGVTFAVETGACVALMGLSGGGKTTVLRTALGLEGFDAGAVSVGGVALAPGPPPAGPTLRALRAQVGMVFQSHGLFDHLTVLENVALAPVYVARLARSDAEGRARELLASLGVERLAASYPREISGGEAQRVAIARTLAMEPPLLLMDEPTASLDPARRNELGRALSALAEGGRTLVVATHDDDFVRDFATRVVVMAEGAVVEEGDPKEVLVHPKHEATRFLLQTKDRLPPPAPVPPKPRAPRVPKGRAPLA